MKKLMLSVVIVFTLAASTAHAFIPQMSYFVNREVAVTKVWNTTYRNITCYGQAYGRTWQGVVLNSYVNGIVIFPGQAVDVYVYSNYYDPMVQAWAQIDCHIW